MRKLSVRSFAVLAFSAAMFVAPSAFAQGGTTSGGGTVSGGGTKTACVSTITYYGVTITSVTTKNGCNGNGGVDTSTSSSTASTVVVSPAP